jgi:N-acetylglucosamine-6-phosphate deacetylase
MSKSLPLDGLFDLQVNGFGGVDFQGPTTRSAIRHACVRLHECGMRRILATFITDSPERLLGKLEAFESYRNQDPLIRDTVVGYHLEGPYMSAEPGYCGAHPAELMRDPDWSEFQRQQEAAGGAIRLVTLAPERNGSEEFIFNATQSGVCISLGHTNATELQIDAAIRAGATLCTHLGNGCPETLPRHDNIIQRLLARDELTACLIPDGIHLPPGVLRNLFRAKPPGKVLLTTDAMAAAGAGPGRYRIGRVEVEVGPDEVVRMPGASNFAGSALRLDQGVERAARWLGIELEAARTMASTAVAEALGMPPISNQARLPE